MVLTYEKALDKVRDILSKEKNIARFCRENGLNNVTVYLLKNGSKNDIKGDRYPDLVKKILEIKGYAVELEKTFIYRVTKKLN